MNHEMRRREEGGTEALGLGRLGEKIVTPRDVGHGMKGGRQPDWFLCRARRTLIRQVKSRGYASRNPRLVCGVDHMKLKKDYRHV